MSGPTASLPTTSSTTCGGTAAAPRGLQADDARTRPRGAAEPAQVTPGRAGPTRAYHPGEHVVDIQADGLAKATERFDLRT